MKKRIYANMLLLAFLSVILTSVFLSMTFYRGFTKQVENELENAALFLEQFLNNEENQSEHMEQLDFTNADVRITIIEPSGTVIYDNEFTDEEHLENHGEREEILAAVQNGFGKGSRLSATGGEETYYYAVRLANDNVVRTAKTTSSIYGVVISVLPQVILIVVVILLACFIGARRLTGKIVDPINKFDFDENAETYDELSPFIRTITAQKEQISAVLDEVIKKSAVIDAITGNMSEGLILTDKHGTVLSANSSAMTLLDIKIAPIGENILVITRNLTVLEHMKTALTGQNSNVSLEIVNRTYHIFFSSVDNGVLILFLDITEKATAEKMRREFTANVSHELKTPLTTIAGYAELMINGMVKAEDIPGVSKKMKKESDRLLALIEDIMRLSEIDEVGNEKDFETIDLTQLIFDVAKTLKYKADEHNISVNIPKETINITANHTMMFELVYNLIDNAIKYNQPQGHIDVAVIQSCGSLIISVKDTGIGIDKEHHERIFERFYRVDKSRSKKIGGTGLGLSIVKHIATYHGGHVEIISEKNAGTQVKVTLSDQDKACLD